ncbi:ATP-binding protein [Phocaeicola coprocola]|uniref:ATP-binding protein n=1 Tax=Phocaeicola coprocola TaxID=310298 RepID=UPI002942DC48|nr:ATP-binding protein [Phocaeicola coprocola]
MEYKVVFFNMIKFSEEVTTASLTGNFLKYMDKLMKYDLIILDDFALRSIDEQTRIAPYQLLDDNKENYRLSIIGTVAK